jgi:ubiquinone/menaquinone biosynthesis C-methylase UbiE
MGHYSQVVRLLPVALRQHVGPQRLVRTTEPTAGMNDAQQIGEFDAAGASDLEIHYATVVRLVHTARPTCTTCRVLDLCCGAGHLAFWLNRHLGCQVEGIDLASGMVQRANENAEAAGLHDRAKFRIGSALDLSMISAGSFDVASCVLAAHHFDDLKTVRMLLDGMSRVITKNGVVILHDLCRLKTLRQTKRYCRALAQPGLPVYQQDFFNSMLAAFTAAEFRSIVPADTTDRRWVHLLEPMLQTIQAIVGFPSCAKGQDAPPLAGFPGFVGKRDKMFKAVSGLLNSQLRQAMANG